MFNHCAEVLPAIQRTVCERKLAFPPLDEGDYLLILALHVLDFHVSIDIATLLGKKLVVDLFQVAVDCSMHGHEFMTLQSHRLSRPQKTRLEEPQHEKMYTLTMATTTGTAIPVYRQVQGLTVMFAATAGSWLTKTNVA